MVREDITSTGRHGSHQAPTQRADILRLREDFRQLHGRRLMGFATLLLLGDAARAAALAGESIALGAQRVTQLRHPERAAAWLRADLLARARRARTAGGSQFHEAAAALRASPGVIHALGRLDLAARAAIIAAEVEHLDLRDIEAIVGRRRGGIPRLLLHARRRFGAAYEEEDGEPGPIGRRVNASAANVGLLSTPRGDRPGGDVDHASTADPW